MKSFLFSRKISSNGFLNAALWTMFYGSLKTNPCFKIWTRSRKKIFTRVIYSDGAITVSSTLLNLSRAADQNDTLNVNLKKRDPYNKIYPVEYLTHLATPP